MTINILERVEAAMREDTSVARDHNERIEAIYTTADAPTRQTIDDLFTSLCGWSLRSLLAGKDQRDEDEDEAEAQP